MATPAFPEVGRGSREQFEKVFHNPAVRTDTGVPLSEVPLNRDKPLREAFWYKRTFTVPAGKGPVARLRIGQAAYGTKVWLNGQLIGEHWPCFTPGWFDLSAKIKPGAENELVVRVGAWRDAVQGQAVEGFDFEKTEYLPGIFDDVELDLSGKPTVTNLQAAPQLSSTSVRVVAEIGEMEAGKSTPVDFVVTEARTGWIAGRMSAVIKSEGQIGKADVVIPLSQAHLWSPEDPFLYKVEVHTPGDVAEASFGMREFRLNPKTKFAELNGDTYFLRGSNLAIYRYYEDPARGGDPWDEKWVRKLARQLKSMHWNIVRTHMSLAPEMWLRVFDEEGLLVAEEYPIWYFGSTPKYYTKELLTSEFTDWLRARWNHPSIAIWNSQNETYEAGTCDVLHQVRQLDLSDRPWDNSYGKVDRDSDVWSTHPYAFIGGNTDMAQFVHMPKIPDTPGSPNSGRPYNGKNPIIINEYGWLWLNRKGEPTRLTADQWKHLAPDATPAERFRIYARVIAAKTEFWRSARTLAGVMEFCGLTYGGKPSQATGDHWEDVHTLEWEPNYANYVRDAFSPVGIMIDLWGRQAAAPGSKITVPIAVINDLRHPWKGTVRLAVWQRGKEIGGAEEKNIEVNAFGRAIAAMSISFPTAVGDYEVAAELNGPGIEKVRSWRDWQVK